MTGVDGSDKMAGRDVSGDLEQRRVPHQPRPLHDDVHDEHTKPDHGERRQGKQPCIDQDDEPPLRSGEQRSHGKDGHDQDRKPREDHAEAYDQVHGLRIAGATGS